MIKKILIGFGIIIISLVAYHFIKSCNSYSYTAVNLPDTFEEFYSSKRDLSKEQKARPNNEEKLIKFKKKTPYAILYIHGYGACRGEGELVVSKIANQFKYNTYFLRLPGHGTNKDNHANTSMNELLDESISTLKMMNKLGDKVIVIGTSMGGLLATYLAAEYKEDVDALVLTSPFYQFADTTGKAVTFRPVYKLVTLLMPERVDNSPIPKEEDNWTLYWYKSQKLTALQQLLDLRNFVAKDSVFNKVSSPVLLLYYFKDEKNQDPRASVSDMKDAFSEFNNGEANPLSRIVAVKDGAHVLMSKYVEADHKFVESELAAFIRSLNK